MKEHVRGSSLPPLSIWSWEHMMECSGLWYVDQCKWHCYWNFISLLSLLRWPHCPQTHSQGDYDGYPHIRFAHDPESFLDDAANTLTGNRHLSGACLLLIFQSPFLCSWTSIMGISYSKQLSFPPLPFQAFPEWSYNMRAVHFTMTQGIGLDLRYQSCSHDVLISMLGMWGSHR